MKVKMNVQTKFMGEKLLPGDEIEVNDAVAARWSKNRIATIIDEGGEKDPKDMSAKELFKLCVEKGLEVAEKQPKAVYLKALGIEDAE